MGGYIGFISYDFSAHQFINGQNHIQPSIPRPISIFLKYIDNDWYFLVMKKMQLIYSHILKIK